tara:strand:+ start:250 stop:636 length:387 start_codon:yes stop_codon:yes gene_type:complete
MPSITVNFSNELNESVQLGDTLYYVNPASETMQGDHDSSGTQTPILNSNTVVEVGVITAINYATGVITADIDNSTALPTGSSFFLFSKDNRANMASLLGYYAEIELSNNATIKAELFSVGSEIFESSK